MISNKKNKNRPANVFEAFRQIDIFGANLPAFNLSGKTQVLTVSGGLLTALLLVVFIGYATLKLTHLIDKKNPLIAELKETNFYDFNTRVNFNDMGYKMAFTVEGYLDGKIKDDPRYVKLLARMFYITDGETHEKILSLHKCTEEDWSEFPEPARGMEDQFADVKDNPDRGMYCLDTDEMEGLEIYGDEKNQQYSRLEVVLLPCNYLHVHLGYTEDVIHPECIANLEQ